MKPVCGCGAVEGRWRVRGVKLEQVGQSAGMQEPQLVLDCKCVKSKGGRSAPAEHVWLRITARHKGSGLKRHESF